MLYVVSETSSRTLEKDELISAGMLGLVNAAKSFEDRGNLFCTYAKFHIRNEIWKAARRARSVVWRDHGLFRSKYCFRLKRERAILACSDIDESEIVRIVSEKYDLNTDDVRAFYEEIGHSDVRLDAPVSAEIDAGSRVESWDLATRRSSLEEVLEVELKESIRVSLETLHPRDRQILEETTYSDSPVTFADLAKRLGVSRERIRQIHDRALCKLRVKLLALGVLACKAA